MARVLVTGGSGFIGQQIVKELRKNNFDVHVLDLFPLDVEGIHHFYGSVIDHDAVSRAMLGCDYVFHMAAILGVSKADYAPAECLDVNILGTRNVLKCAVLHRVKKVVFPSSSEVYGEPKEIPVHENVPLQPKPEYGVSKTVGEEYIKAYHRQHGLHYTILRYFNVYGEMQTHSWVMPKFVNNALLGKELRVFGDGSQVRAFCHVDDAARASVAALTSQHATNQIFNIGNGTEPLSMMELARKIIFLSSSSSGIASVSLEQSDRTKEREIFRRIPSTEKARAAFGFCAAICVDEGIQRMIEYKLSRLEPLRREVEAAEQSEHVMKRAAL